MYLLAITLVVESLPEEYRRMLLWRMSPITPNIVKLCIARSEFKATTSTCHLVVVVVAVSVAVDVIVIIIIIKCTFTLVTKNL